MDTLCRLYFLTDTVLGFGALRELSPAMRAAGISRPFLVADRGIAAAGLTDRIVEAMDTPPVATFLDTPANPTKAACEAAARAYVENEADGVVAVGGGSPIDLAKAVLVLATHDGAFESYDAVAGGTALIDGTRLPPLIAVPTTAGTGSEVGQSAVISVPGERKYILRHPGLKPRTAISDPDLTLSLPRAMTVGSGMDAMTHCIEGFLSPRPNPPAEAVALDGLRRIWNHLERAAADGDDREARWHLLMGSAEGGMAMTNGLGAVHAMSHAAGGAARPQSSPRHPQRGLPAQRPAVQHRREQCRPDPARRGDRVPRRRSLHRRHRGAQPAARHPCRHRRDGRHSGPRAVAGTGGKGGLHGRHQRPPDQRR
ncbi:iron-containing alcohol dehydrogenase [Acuticoccus sediminis]|uniref:iron-containing alcohol dehydrogenase n=1 Tax=Acuticoccus sediminis TaxID=2184697 RepID=UPI00192E4BF5